MRNRTSLILLIVILTVLLLVAMISIGCRNQPSDRSDGGGGGGNSGAAPSSPPSTNSQPQPKKGNAYLVITSLDVSPSSVNRDQEVNITVRVQNQGDGPSGGYGVNIHAVFESDPMHKLDIGIDRRGGTNLAPGATAEFNIPGSHFWGGYTQPVGLYEIRAEFSPPRSATAEGRLDANVAKQRLIVN